MTFINNNKDEIKNLIYHTKNILATTELVPSLEKILKEQIKEMEKLLDKFDLIDEHR